MNKAYWDWYPSSGCPGSSPWAPKAWVDGQTRDRYRSSTSPCIMQNEIGNQVHLNTVYVPIHVCRYGYVCIYVSIHFTACHLFLFLCMTTNVWLSVSVRSRCEVTSSGHWERKGTDAACSSCHISWQHPVHASILHHHSHHQIQHPHSNTLQTWKIPTPYSQTENFHVSWRFYVFERGCCI